VLATWAGLRPLIAADAAKTSDVSREHELFYETGGVITVAGGKLTTYRRMAREVVDAAIRELRHRGFAADAGECTTDERPLPGAIGLSETVTLDTATAAVARRADLPEDVARNLVMTFGVHAPRLADLVARDRSLGARLDPELPYIWAQLVYAVETELAITVDDVLGRRIPLLLMARDQGLGVAAEVARRMGALLGWDAAARERSVAQYREAVAASRRFRSE
jgi:glycerol-3-phosphate dehydrogenase